MKKFTFFLDFFKKTKVLSRLVSRTIDEILKLTVGNGVSFHCQFGHESKCRFNFQGH